MAWHRTSSSERGYGAEWRRLRKQAIKRDMGLCVVCMAEGRITPFRDVDHIKPRNPRDPQAVAGTETLDNLQCLCGPCHDWKTANESNGITRRAIGADGWPI